MLFAFFGDIVYIILWWFQDSRVSMNTHRYFAAGTTDSTEPRML